MQDIESGKIERRLGRRATCTSDADEVRFFGSLPNGSDAFMLLQLFRGEHEARCRRGETFVIAIDAMVRDRVMGSWAARRYREARDLLLREGFIRQTCPARSTRAAEYLLEPRVLTPSLRACEKAALPMDVMRGGGRQKRSIVEHFAPAVPVPSVPAAPLMQAPFSETARISLNKTEPWLADGISRRTWFRKQKSAAARTDGRARS